MVALFGGLEHTAQPHLLSITGLTAAAAAAAVAAVAASASASASAASASAASVGAASVFGCKDCADSEGDTASLELGLAGGHCFPRRVK